jgi:CheY-like chemotaxis protein
MRILIVEDHDDTRDALERFLSRCGYGVAVAADLRTALNLLQAQPFDALVSDIALPASTSWPSHSPPTVIRAAATSRGLLDSIITSRSRWIA